MADLQIQINGNPNLPGLLKDISGGAGTRFANPVVQVDANGNAVTSGGDASAANQATEIALLTTIRDNADTLEALTGALTETAPASDTASSGLNGRLQRIAQRLTSLIALLPTALGQGTMSQSLKVVLPSDQSSIPVTPAATAVSGGISTTTRMAASAATTNATLVKGSAGRIYAIQARNNAAYDIFLVLYDSAASPPVPGSTTIRKKVCIPASSNYFLEWPAVGLGMATGIGFAFTKLVADADTTAIAANDITAFNVDYV